MTDFPDLSANEQERLRALYREAMRAAPAPGGHPSEDDWERLAADELSVQERAVLADHIVACEACGDVYRAVAYVRSEAPAFDPGAVPPASLAGHAADSAPAASSWTWRDLALAAALVAAVAAGAWAWTLRSRVGTLEGQIAEMRPVDEIVRLEAAARSAEDRAAALERNLSEGQQPGLNAPIVDLEPDSVRSAASRRAAVVVPEGARYFTLVFTFTVGTTRGAPFSVDITRADGARVGAWPGVAPGAFQTASMVVPVALVPPGEYTVRLLTSTGATMQSHVLVIRTEATETPRP